MSSKNKISDKIIRWLWYSVATVILTSAVLISLIRFALTEIDSYKENIEQLASKAVGHQVYIESLGARLVGMSPTLVLEGVHILSEDNVSEVLRVNKAHVGFSVVQSIKLRRVIPNDIMISGTKLALIRLKNGNVRVRGFEFPTKNKVTEKSGERLTSWFFSQTSLAVKESTIIWKDYKRNTPQVSFSDIDIEISNNGNAHRLTGSFSPSKSLGTRLEVAMDIVGDLQKPSGWKGEFFVQGDEIFLAKWGERITHNKVELTDGIADFQLWGSLGENGQTKIYGDISAYQLKVKDKKSNKQLDISLLGGLFEFTYNKHDWQLNVDRFQYTGTGGILPETSFSITSKSNIDTAESLLDIRVAKLDLEGWLDKDIFAH